MKFIVCKVGNPNLYYNEDANRWGFFNNATKYNDKEDAGAIIDEAEDMMPGGKFIIVEDI